ncbi:ATP-binding protein [Fodinicola feengrottensis]|uniref:DNA topoisomerase (ATP-hydrolyzing) n=1 Tax=Fodinicola feengrottensis TaxID=435914 RepID=A0ABP4V265_9ACTN|nr:ATP-binding protein [Fodinicola feengrottensis]
MDEAEIRSLTTTHDWASAVDLAHLKGIREDPRTFAPGGVRHLVLEVVAYAADEAEHTGRGQCVVTLHPDGSVSVADDGRGTDTRLDDHGRAIRKPVMATKDLRFFDFPEAPPLPDGEPRRGMSVVAALSDWLVHTNRREGGAWTQRYEQGVPVTELVPIEPDGTTGTTVRFRPDSALSAPPVDDLARLTTAWPSLSVRIQDHRPGPHVAVTASVQKPH